MADARTRASGSAGSPLDRSGSVPRRGVPVRALILVGVLALLIFPAPAITPWLGPAAAQEAPGPADRSSGADRTTDAEPTDGADPSEETVRPEDLARESGRPVVYLLPISGAISPVTANYLLRGIATAEEANAEAVVIEMDTPGGLDAAMRRITKGILGAQVPVVVYVAPAGARAASAGMYITLAAPIAAMAPGTNIGAATPVSLGGGDSGGPDTTMTAKVTNDAAAYARSLARRHGRNVEFAERAVVEAISISAEEALEDSVIDLIAPSVEALLERIDGRTVVTAMGETTLRTAGAEIRSVEMSWREDLLALISDPNIAYLLFLAGILGIALELYNPGAILPGVVGAISLILAFFAFQSLPVQVAGILLILLGVVLFILEIKVTSFGILSIGGVASLVLGSLFLFEPGSAYRISVSVLVPAVLTFAAFFLFVVYKAAQTLARPHRTGALGMRGEVGEVVTALSTAGYDGKVFVHGEYWFARGTVPVEVGARVRIREVDGLRLVVEPAEAAPSPQGRVP